MKLRYKFATTLALLTSPTLQAAETTPEVPLEITTDAGPVVGIAQNGTSQWLGIPFAAAPVGPRRWQPPQRPARWTLPLKTQAYGKECAQNADLGVFGKAGGSEDCLYLNVIAPPQAAHEKLPVFVWIYGGSLLVGAADDYDPVKMALTGKAVVVTFNYRVGIFGFFAHPDLAKAKAPTGNYGLMDQQMALDWVQRNIANFGGDPKRVTIAGESSGGGSVLAQIVSPAAAGKFSTGIAMSGAALALKAPRFGSEVPLQAAIEKGRDFAKAMDCEKGGLACLQALPTEAILAKQRPFTIVRPIIDGKILPIGFAQAFKTGRLNKVTLIQGSTRDEARFFVGLGENGGAAPMNEDQFIKTMTGYFGADLAPAAIKEYRLDQFENPTEAYAAAVTDYFFACPALAFNRWAAGKIPVYAYEFADRTAPAYLKPTSFHQAASHTYELPYLFPGFHGGAGLPVALNPLQERLSDAIVPLWAQGGLASGTKLAWSQYDEGKDNVLTLDLMGPREQSGQFRKAHRCDFWDRSGAY